jgi:dTDP-4-dehydrorhamnose 3,5-epimerase-like enzyme
MKRSTHRPAGLRVIEPQVFGDERGFIYDP